MGLTPKPAVRPGWAHSPSAVFPVPVWNPKGTSQKFTSGFFATPGSAEQEGGEEGVAPRVFFRTFRNVSLSLQNPDGMCLHSMFFGSLGSLMESFGIKQPLRNRVSAPLTT